MRGLGVMRRRQSSEIARTGEACDERRGDGNASRAAGRFRLLGKRVASPSGWGRLKGKGRADYPEQELLDHEGPGAGRPQGDDPCLDQRLPPDRRAVPRTFDIQLPATACIGDGSSGLATMRPTPCGVPDYLLGRNSRAWSVGPAVPAAAMSPLGLMPAGSLMLHGDWPVNVWSRLGAAFPSK